MKITIDKFQGYNVDENQFGYVAGEDGGWFFTWLGTEEETLDSLEVDEVDGDGEITYNQARMALKKEIKNNFR